MDINSSVAASRLVAQQRASSVTGNNIANANTPGFKYERVQFADWLNRQTGIDTPRGGAPIVYAQDRATWRDLQPGSLSQTGNTFDVALTGDGFFTVSTQRGVRLTRDGRFGLTPDGTLADSTGNAVLDANGQPLRMPPNARQIAIAGDGSVSTDSGPVGKLGVVSPNDPGRLRAEGATLLNAPTGTNAITRPRVVQGALEESNVQPVLELTHMLADAKEFQFVTQFLQAESDRQQGAIDKLLPTTN